MLNYKNFKTDSGGNVAMMFAVTTAMILTAVGAAVDYTNLTRARTALQAQVDAGVLAAATVEVERLNNGKFKQEKKTREDAAFQVAEANGFDLSGGNPVLTIGRKSVVMQAEFDYKPSFGGILGIDKIRLKASAESGLPGQDGVDIVLVLDNTESMRVNGKMDALKNGAVGLIDAIEASQSETKIGIVPFARYVRLEDKFRTASWLDLPVEFTTSRTSTYNYVDDPGTCTTVPRTRTIDGVEEEYNSSSCTGRTYRQEEVTSDIESRWDGCVGTRMPPYSERDDSYSNKIPGLLNTDPKENTGLSWDINSWCPAAITELTNDYDELRDDIQRMWTTDSTYLPIGISWGRRVLSPGEPFDNAPEAGLGENRKFIVLMTDGNNTTEIMQDTAAESEMRSPPYISNVASDEIATEANAATLRLCENAKADGTNVYTIAFQVTDAATKTLLRKCASSNAHAMTADSNAALIERFQNLSSRLSADIRLMR